MFFVTNAWHDIPFCDPTRGLHCALNAELLHTLQQGIFEYAIINLFAIKKTPKTKTKNQVRTKICKHDMQETNKMNNTQRTQNAIDIVNTNAIDINEY